MDIGVFGTGSALKDFLSIVPAEHRIVGLADNNTERHGLAVEGHPIVSPQALVDLAPEFIVIAARAVDEIRAQLVSLGYPAGRICRLLSQLWQGPGQACQ